MPLTRREVNEYVKSQEEPNQHYECEKCLANLPADNFRIKTSYSSRANKLYCNRDKLCSDCANERDAAVSRNQRNEPQGYYRKQLKDAPFIAAEKVLRERPEAVAILARSFPKEFGDFHDKEKQRIIEAWKNMRVNASEAKTRKPPKGRVWSDSDIVAAKTNKDTVLQFSQRRIQTNLTDEAVADIRYLYEFEGVSAAKLAERYNRNESTIYNIVSGRSYKKVK